MLLLDEPFGGVDLPSAELLTALVDELALAGRGLLDRDARRRAGELVGRVLCLEPAGGRVRPSGATS